MQNKEKTCACPSGGFKTMCGGQALIEGIMMRGPKKQAVVVRKPDGTLAIRESQLRFIKDRFPVLGLPLIRGMVTFVASMVEGVRALMYSAEFFPEEEGETEEPSRFEAWLERTLGSDRAASVFVTVSVILGIGMSIGLFFLLPHPAGLGGDALYRFHGGPQCGGEPDEAGYFCGLSGPLLPDEGHSPGVPVPWCGA